MPLLAQAPKPKPPPVATGSGLEVVKDSESGGKDLPKEDISDDILALLKKYK